MAPKKLVFIDRLMNPPGLGLLQAAPNVVEMVQANSKEPDAMWADLATAYGVGSGIRLGVDTEELIQKSPNYYNWGSFIGIHHWLVPALTRRRWVIAQFSDTFVLVRPVSGAVQFNLCLNWPVWVPQEFSSQQNHVSLAVF